MENARNKLNATGWDEIVKDDFEDVIIDPEEAEDDDPDGIADDIFEDAGTPAVKLERGDEEIVDEDEVELELSRTSSFIANTRDDADWSNGGGLIYHAKIIRNGYKNKTICNKNGELKARRAVPLVYQDDFFNSLSQTKQGNWVYNGLLNGWPAITKLELLSLEYVYQKKVGGKTRTVSKRFWKKSPGGKNAPQYPKPGYGFFKVEPKSIRAKLRTPSWADYGYSANNPGHVWYFSRFREGGPRVAHGENIISAILSDSKNTGEPVPKAVRAHFFGHRYVKKKKQLKDPIEYHTGVVIEWDHGEFCTLFELAWLNGSSGRSNWCEDRDAERPQLYEAMPACLKAPWFSNRNEIRITDITPKNLEEFYVYLKRYEGKRFLKPDIKYSGDVRLSNNSFDWLVRYIINYNLREPRYSERTHNCQNFAADFYSFVCAKNNVSPYAPISAFHREKRHMFLYKPEMFEIKNKKLGLLGKTN